MITSRRVANKTKRNIETSKNFVALEGERAYHGITRKQRLSMSWCSF